MVKLYNSTTNADILAVHNMQEGTIIKVYGQYESLSYRLVKNAPEWRTYEEILAGTDLYTQYGPNCFIAYGNSPV